MTTVAFLHAQMDPTCAELMVHSVKAHMLGMKLLQLTDEDTPEIPGCKAIRRHWDGNTPMEFRLRHLAELTGEVIVLDTDCIVQQDLRPVFWFPFDAALTQRDGPEWDTNGFDVTLTMPFNCGVMFSRNPAFWRACLDWIAENRENGWYADQLAVAAVAKRFNVLKLHCDNFNVTPRSRNEDTSRAYVVHYKGKRKDWMIERHKERIAHVA